MGICVSAPAEDTNSDPCSKRSRRVRSTRELSGQQSVRRSPFTNVIRNRCVLNQQAGGNIREKYTFGKELGRGEFGVTNQCVEVATGVTYACKKISKSKLRTEVDIEDVRREVEIMRKLPKHPNIVEFKEAYEDVEAVYLVMELCQGGELFDRIVARGHYTERAAAQVTKTILEVVKVCHKNGVIHRDLKPENFLFAGTNENDPIKAIDFGLSIFFEPGQSFAEIVGSPYYMAPEVLRRNYGPEVDVWSAGVILYILLCGVPPFWAETEEGIAQAIIQGTTDYEKDPWPKISDEAKDLVKNMLDPNPFSRFTLQEVLDHSWLRNPNQARDVSLGDDVKNRIKQFSVMNRFKKKVLRVVADNLPDDEVASIKEMFQMMDADKNGDLTFEELKEGLNSTGHPVTDHDVRMLMEAADLDGNGTLDCEEFITMSVHLKRIAGDDHLAQAFNLFDKDRNGYIEYNELREALNEGNPSPNNDKQIKEILFDIDLDKDGRISFEEFKAMMKNGMDWKMQSRQYSRAMLNALSIKMFRPPNVAFSGELKYPNDLKCSSELKFYSTEFKKPSRLKNSATRPRK